jgi:hypothetical protein
MPNTPFLAGAASRNITPSLGERPVFLAGFQGDRRATAVHSDLYARALAMRLGDRVAVLVACDLIGLHYDDIAEIRAALAPRDIPPDSLIVACTHIHSGPDTLGLWGPDQASSGVAPAYLASVKRAVAEAALEALTFGCPVRMRAAMARMPAGYVANYRTPGVVDDEIAVVQFERPNGEILATLLNLACHPEVLMGDSSLISADYAGAACRAIEQAAGGVALHVSGALGGMLSPAIEQRNADGVAAMGQAYAEAALAALAQSELAEIPRFEFRRATFSLPMTNLLFARAQEAGVLRRRGLAEGELTTTCAYVDLGLAQIITIPGELLPRLGFELKAALPGPVRVLAGIADDELGYILPDDEFVAPADYLNPGAQYEESMSIGPNTGSLVMAAATELINRKT